MKNFKIVDSYKEDIICEGNYESLKEFYSSNLKKIHDYENKLGGNYQDFAYLIIDNKHVDGREHADKKEIAYKNLEKDLRNSYTKYLMSNFKTITLEEFQELELSVSRLSLGVIISDLGTIENNYKLYINKRR